MTTVNQIRESLRLLELHDRFIQESTVFDEQTKNAFYHKSKYIRDFLIARPETTAYQLKTITNDLLTYWNESITPDTERFWTTLKIQQIDIVRKDPFELALIKKRFKNVEQGMDARNNWEALKQLKSITDRFSETDIQQINSIIAEDEENRYYILKSCLRKKAIPPTKYLKFGECMAYFANCGLFDAYFGKEQTEELYNIWKNFK